MKAISVAKSLQIIQKEVKTIESWMLSNGDVLSDPDLILPQEVADILGVSRPYVYVLKNEGKITPVKIGKYLLFSKREILSFKRAKKARS
jgi:excisionase family DNA binding protein